MENENNKPNVCPGQDCGCVGYAFVPIQTLDKVYNPETALAQGTLFPELDLSIDEYGKVCKAEGGIR